MVKKNASKSRKVCLGRVPLSWSCLIMAFLLIFFVFLGGEFRACSQPHIAPEFTLNSTLGGEVSLSSFKGKTVVLVFWALYCPPSREEVLNLAEIQKKFKEKGVEVLGIALDKETPKISDFVEANKISFPILYSKDPVLDAYLPPKSGVQSIPAIFILDPDLKVIKKYEGYVEKAALEIEFEKIFISLQSGNGAAKSAPDSKNASTSEIASGTVPSGQPASGSP